MRSQWNEKVVEWRIKSPSFLSSAWVFSEPLLQTTNEVLTLFKILRDNISTSSRTRYMERRSQNPKKKHGLPQSCLPNPKEKLFYLRESSKLSLMIAHWVNTKSRLWSCAVTQSHAFVCTCKKDAFYHLVWSNLILKTSRLNKGSEIGVLSTKIVLNQEDGCQTSDEFIEKISSNHVQCSAIFIRWNLAKNWEHRCFTRSTKKGKTTLSNCLLTSCSPPQAIFLPPNRDMNKEKNEWLRRNTNAENHAGSPSKEEEGYIALG